MRLKVLKLLFFLLLLCNASAYAQTQANFTASDTSICIPFQVKFTDHSTGKIKAWDWDFGDGNFSTAHPEAKRTYTNAGVYIVKLTVTDSLGKKSVATHTIHAFDKPKANFAVTTDSMGCKALTVGFKDLSVSATSVLTHWIWDFGDGNVDVQDKQVLNHTYTQQGSYPVSLTVVDNNGCRSILSKDKQVNVSDKPVVSFSASPPQACKAPFTTTFSNASTGNGALTYQWFFGDTSTVPSVLTAPSHTYTMQGFYTVKLIAKDKNGCSSSLTRIQYIKIAPIVASFSIARDTVCLGEAVNPVNNSVGASVLKWNFGDGTPLVNSISPQHIYATPGNYTIKLIASSGSGAAMCIDSSFTLKINVERVTPDFTTRLHYSCSVPVDITYTDASTTSGKIKKLFWHFGRRDTSIAPGPLTYHHIGPGTYNDTLTVLTVHGCQAQKVYLKNVYIALLSANYSIDTNKGCIPVITTITEQSTGIPTDPITSWAWSFGNGQTFNGKNPPPVTYPVDGSYQQVLIIKNASGCTDTVSKQVVAGTKPHADFSFTPPDDCARHLFSFSDQSTPRDSVNYFFWSFGLHGKNPVTSFRDTGYIPVQLIVGYNGCYDTTLKVGPHTKPPVIDLNVNLINCSDPLTWKLKGIMLGVTDFKWDFGDGTFDIANVNPVHTYPDSSKTYFVQLTAYNSSTGCTDTVGKILKVARIAADFLVDKPVSCFGKTLNFTAAASTDSYRYDWDFGDSNGSTYFSPLTTYNYPAPGVYKVKLTAVDINGCADTAAHTIKVYRPVAKVLTDVTSGCIDFNVNFSDGSTETPAGVNIVKWDWNFSDGSPHVTTRNPGLHAYTNIGNWKVILAIKDSLGCVDTNRTVSINAYEAKAIASIQNKKKICQGETMFFTGSGSTGSNLKYTWNFGDGTTDNKPNTSHKFNIPGKFTASLTVRDTISNCSDILVKNTVSDTIFVQQKPVIDFIADTTHSNCYPLFVKFANNTQYIPIGDSNDTLVYTWSLGAGASSQKKYANRNYPAPGSYTVSLRAVSSFGCADTVTKPDYIVLRGPVALFTLSKDTICKGDNILFNITDSANVAGFNWDFGDGYADSIHSPVSHRYNIALNKIGVNLYISDASNTCIQPVVKEISVRDVFALMQLSDTVICVHNSLDANDISHNELTRSWTFGDGKNSSSLQNVHTYDAVGTFPIQLAITGKFGCIDTVTKKILVNPLPLVNAVGGFICQSDSMQLIASSVNMPLKYSWKPSISARKDTLKAPFVLPSQTTTYTVQVTDTNKCKASDTAIVRVQQYITTSLSSTASVIIGQSITLNAMANPPGVKYLWTPPDGLSCTDCATPTVKTLISRIYTVLIIDTNGCGFKDSARVFLEVQEKYSVDVPNAFTPNGDGINDLVFVNGWGIKRLVSYKIYNRLGELVFETSDIAQGWDGYYKGELQNTETYVYTVLVETYDGKTLVKKGSLSLLR